MKMMMMTSEQTVTLIGRMLDKGKRVHSEVLPQNPILLTIRTLYKKK
jgi:hypothetical protein